MSGNRTTDKMTADEPRWIRGVLGIIRGTVDGEITPAMIDAGVKAYLEWDEVGDFSIDSGVAKIIWAALSAREAAT